MIQMKKLMILILICASVVAYNQSYASGNAFNPGNKSLKSAKTHTTARGHSHVKKNRRLRGYNYYKYANNKAYLRSMGKAINGCR
jgi:hypothetical protein